jgi:hypothetical protein
MFYKIFTLSSYIQQHIMMKQNGSFRKSFTAWKIKVQTARRRVTDRQWRLLELSKYVVTSCPHISILLMIYNYDVMAHGITHNNKIRVQHLTVKRIYRIIVVQRGSPVLYGLWKRLLNWMKWHSITATVVYWLSLCVHKAVWSWLIHLYKYTPYCCKMKCGIVRTKQICFSGH